MVAVENKKMKIEKTRLFHCCGRFQVEAREELVRCIYGSGYSLCFSPSTGNLNGIMSLIFYFAMHFVLMTLSNVVDVKIFKERTCIATGSHTNAQDAASRAVCFQAYHTGKQIGNRGSGSMFNGSTLRRWCPVHFVVICCSERFMVVLRK